MSAVETHVPYTAEEMALVQERLAARISPLEHERRFKVAKAINKRPYILREEAAELFGVYPMSSMAFAAIIMANIMSRGHGNTGEGMAMAVKVAIVAMLGFLFVYGGLIYLGAT